ncbi:hypothetical protein E2C01_101515 [Portunus trituberculatus]|uniref:Uncharacterized protein n=1 Tax=Portunus trituberculatus TaxID=210409 RepID=A0A5B7K5W2_PORTR|nr:hypothetical protein [Portunus trituberculatus]
MSQLKISVEGSNSLVVMVVVVVVVVDVVLKLITSYKLRTP